MVDDDRVKVGSVTRKKSILKSSSWMLRHANRAAFLLSRSYRSCIISPPLRQTTRRMTSSTQPEAGALADEIAAQSSLLNDLRKQQADPAVVEEAKKKLGDLKRSLALQQNANGGAKDGKKKERILLKTAKVRPLSLCANVNSSSSRRPLCLLLLRSVSVVVRHAGHA